MKNVQKTREQQVQLKHLESAAETFGKNWIQNRRYC